MPAETDAHYRPRLEIVGDLAHTLWMLNSRVDAVGELSYNLAQQAGARRDMAADFAEHKDDDTQGIIKPQKVLWDVRAVMGPNDVLLSDVGGAQDVDCTPLSLS